MGAMMDRPDHWNYGTKEETITFITMLEKSKKMPIISVGSGTGKYEQEIMDKLLDDEKPELICVDAGVDYHPSDEMIIQPKYKTVDDLLKERSELIENCLLILIWPYDQSRMTEYNSGVPYDLDAIVKLRPAGIVILYEEFGGAGSHELHYWLSNYTSYHADHLDLHNNNKKYIEKNAPADLKYKTTKVRNWHYGEPSLAHFTEHSLVVIMLTNLDVIEETPNYLCSINDSDESSDNGNNSSNTDLSDED